MTTITKDIDVSTAETRTPHPAAIEAATRNKKLAGLPDPPKPGRPLWAIKDAPTRDDAGVHLFPLRYRDADRFIAWLLRTRQSCASRAVRGHAYLAGTERPSTEDLALYGRLVRWTAWCDFALWWLTQWYAQPDAAPRPHALALPFTFAVEKDGTPQTLVRELSGLAHEQLLEEALTLWREQSIFEGYLKDVWADGPDDDTEEETA